MRGAVVGLLLFPNVMIVHYSVDWWRSLHQKATITRLDPTIEGTMLFTLMLGIVVFTLLFTWMLIHRFRVGWLEERANRLRPRCGRGRTAGRGRRRHRRSSVMGSVAMTDVAYVAAGWTIPLVGLAAYALRTVRRGRCLAERVAPEDRRWS